MSNDVDDKWGINYSFNMIYIHQLNKNIFLLNHITYLSLRNIKKLHKEKQ